jgi:hypothetical protein
MTQPPHQFAPWDHENTDPDIASPLDFEFVMIWRDGDDRPTMLETAKLTSDFKTEGLYWQPVFDLPKTCHYH